MLTNKDEELYHAVVHKIQELIPQLQPVSLMSDWEKAPRNAFMQVYQGVRIHGCWFHYTQAIWRKIQKCGLVSNIRGNYELASFVKKVMAIPFLPADLISSTYSLLQIPTGIQPCDCPKLDTFFKYFQKHWLNAISHEELSIFALEYGTNNGAESYHAQLKSAIKSSHPRIWSFMHTLNNIIADYDNEMARLKQGLEITRLRKKKHRNNEERRRKCKELLISGCLTPLEFLEKMSISHCTSLKTAHLSSSSEDSDTLEDVIHTNICVVCLQPRGHT